MWGRGGVTAKSPSGMLPAAAPASCKGTGCSMPMPCFPTPKGEKSNPGVTKKPNPGTCQMSPFPQRGIFCPNTTTLLHLLSDELDGIFILHPTLDQGQRHKDRSAERQKQWLSLPSHTAQRLISII